MHVRMRASHLAVGGAAQVVLVVLGAAAASGIRIPKRIELAHLAPRLRRAAEAGGRRAAGAGGTLLGIESGEELRVHRVEAARAVLVPRVGRRREVKPQAARRVSSLAAVGGGATAQDGVAVLVVPAALVRVSEHGMCALQLLEPRLCLLTAVEVPVRVPQERLLAVRLLQLVVCGSDLHAKHGVVAPKRHRAARMDGTG